MSRIVGKLPTMSAPFAMQTAHSQNKASLKRKPKVVIENGTIFNIMTGE